MDSVPVLSNKLLDKWMIESFASKMTPKFLTVQKIECFWCLGKDDGSINFYWLYLVRMMNYNDIVDDKVVAREIVSIIAAWKELKLPTVDEIWRF